MSSEKVSVNPPDRLSENEDEPMSDKLFEIVECDRFMNTEPNVPHLMVRATRDLPDVGVLVLEEEPLSYVSATDLTGDTVLAPNQIAELKVAFCMNNGPDRHFLLFSNPITLQHACNIIMRDPEDAKCFPALYPFHRPAAIVRLERLAFMTCIRLLKKHVSPADLAYWAVFGHFERLYDVCANLSIIMGTAITSHAFGAGIYRVASRFNHSCVPNCRYTSYEGRILVSTFRPIKAGEELCIPYAHFPVGLTSVSSIRGTLKRLLSFECQCAHCTQRHSVWKAAEPLSLDELAVKYPSLHGHLRVIKQSAGEQDWDTLLATVYAIRAQHEDLFYTEPRFTLCITTRYMDAITNGAKGMNVDRDVSGWWVERYRTTVLTFVENTHFHPRAFFYPLLCELQRFNIICEEPEKYGGVDAISNVFNTFVISFICLEIMAKRVYGSLNELDLEVMLFGYLRDFMTTHQGVLDRCIADVKKQWTDEDKVTWVVSSRDMQQKNYPKRSSKYIAPFIHRPQQKDTAETKGASNNGTNDISGNDIIQVKNIAKKNRKRQAVKKKGKKKRKPRKTAKSRAKSNTKKKKNKKNSQKVATLDPQFKDPKPNDDVVDDAFFIPMQLDDNVGKENIAMLMMQRLWKYLDRKTVPSPIIATMELTHVEKYTTLATMTVTITSTICTLITMSITHTVVCLVSMTCVEVIKSRTPPPKIMWADIPHPELQMPNVQEMGKKSTEQRQQAPFSYRDALLINRPAVLAGMSGKGRINGHMERH